MFLHRRTSSSRNPVLPASTSIAIKSSKEYKHNRRGDAPWTGSHLQQQCALPLCLVLYWKCHCQCKWMRTNARCNAGISFGIWQLGLRSFVSAFFHPSWLESCESTLRVLRAFAHSFHGLIYANWGRIIDGVVLVSFLETLCKSESLRKWS